jgi:hypothetical protein
MPISTRILALAAVLAVPLAASAQEVKDREANQQGRIANGVATGQLTAGETAHLENREARINATRKADLAANGGHLTAAEHRSLNHREDRLSHKIYQDKHNDATQPGVPPR